MTKQPVLLEVNGKIEPGYIIGFVSYRDGDVNDALAVVEFADGRLESLDLSLMKTFDLFRDHGKAEAAPTIQKNEYQLYRQLVLAVQSLLEGGLSWDRERQMNALAEIVGEIMKLEGKRK